MDRQRLKVGIIYIHSSDWVGGNYYIQNLVASFNLLAEAQQPDVTVFTLSEAHFEELVNNSKYKRLSAYYLGRSRLGLVQRIANKVGISLFKKRFFWGFNEPLDVVFPGSYENLFSPTQPFLYWIPDFQEAHLSYFFSEEELQKRAKLTREIIEKGKYIVLSSESAKEDFNHFYPNNGMKQWVMPFAVTHTVNQQYSHAEICDKYNLPQQFFLCSNQFWRHKNQLVALQALQLILSEHPNQIIHIAFTGKEEDYRDQTYFPMLKAFCQDNNLENHVSFLGFIPRNDQLNLMKYATAIIQPSLFEGWSTVVEDAKSFGQMIIASDLNVHKEQLDHYPNKAYFNPTDSSALAQSIIRTSNEKKERYKYAYKADILRYAEQFIHIIHQLNMKGE